MCPKDYEILKQLFEEIPTDPNIDFSKDYGGIDNVNINDFLAKAEELDRQYGDRPEKAPVPEGVQFVEADIDNVFQTRWDTSKIKVSIAEEDRAMIQVNDPDHPGQMMEVKEPAEIGQVEQIVYQPDPNVPAGETPKLTEQKISHLNMRKVETALDNGKRLLVTDETGTTYAMRMQDGKIEISDDPISPDAPLENAFYRDATPPASVSQLYLRFGRDGLSHAVDETGREYRGFQEICKAVGNGYNLLLYENGTNRHYAMRDFGGDAYISISPRTSNGTFKEEINPIEAIEIQLNSVIDRDRKAPVTDSAGRDRESFAYFAVDDEGRRYSSYDQIMHALSQGNNKTLYLYERGGKSALPFVALEAREDGLYSKYYGQEEEYKPVEKKPIRENTPYADTSWKEAFELMGTGFLDSTLDASYRPANLEFAMSPDGSEFYPTRDKMLKALEEEGKLLFVYKKDEPLPYAVKNVRGRLVASSEPVSTMNQLEEMENFRFQPKPSLKASDITTIPLPYDANRDKDAYSDAMKFTRDSEKLLESHKQNYEKAVADIKDNMPAFPDPPKHPGEEPSLGPAPVPPRYSGMQKVGRFFYKLITFGFGELNSYKKYQQDLKDFPQKEADYEKEKETLGDRKKEYAVQKEEYELKKRVYDELTGDSIIRDKELTDRMEEILSMDKKQLDGVSGTELLAAEYYKSVKEQLEKRKLYEDRLEKLEQFPDVLERKVAQCKDDLQKLQNAARLSAEELRTKQEEAKEEILTYRSHPEVLAEAVADLRKTGNITPENVFANTAILKGKVRKINPGDMEARQLLADYFASAFYEEKVLDEQVQNPASGATADRMLEPLRNGSASREIFEDPRFQEMLDELPPTTEYKVEHLMALYSEKMQKPLEKNMSPLERFKSERERMVSEFGSRPIGPDTLTSLARLNELDKIITEEERREARTPFRLRPANVKRSNMLGAKAVTSDLYGEPGKTRSNMVFLNHHLREQDKNVLNELQEKYGKKNFTLDELAQMTRAKLSPVGMYEAEKKRIIDAYGKQPASVQAMNDLARLSMLDKLIRMEKYANTQFYDRTDEQKEQDLKQASHYIEEIRKEPGQSQLFRKDDYIKPMQLRTLEAIENRQKTAQAKIAEQFASLPKQVRDKMMPKVGEYRLDELQEKVNGEMTALGKYQGARRELIERFGEQPISKESLKDVAKLKELDRLIAEEKKKEDRRPSENMGEQEWAKEQRQAQSALAELDGKPGAGKIVHLENHIGKEAGEALDTLMLRNMDEHGDVKKVGLEKLTEMVDKEKEVQAEQARKEAEKEQMKQKGFGF